MPKAGSPLPPLSLRPHPHLLEIPARSWLEELSARYGKKLRLGQVPDAEWNRLKMQGFDLVWLMGVWRRSRVARQAFRTDSRRYPGYDKALSDWSLADIVGSPYAVQEYRPDPRIGSWNDIDRVRRKLRERGMGLILDFVCNHTALDHAWVNARPGCYLEGSEAEFRRDPANFSLREEDDGALRFLAHGRDPYFPAWPDTAQLNHFHPETRSALLEVIRELSNHADGLRCDMAMLALGDIFARTWSAQRIGPAPGGEFWQEAIASAPELIWLAESYWGTEARLQELGFQFTYDKPFYDALRGGSGADLRARLGGGLETQKRFARFLENHDEQRAAAVFGDGRMQAVATLAVTAPGMRFFFHGQLEGRQIFVPVELGRAPEEPGDAEVRELYESLFTIADQEVFHSGQWTLHTAETAGDRSHENLVVYAWKSESEWKLVAANPTGAAAQGRVALSEGVERGAQYLLRDQLNGAVYSRSGAELAAGLYVRLEPGRAHVFDVGRVGARTSAATAENAKPAEPQAQVANAS